MSFSIDHFKPWPNGPASSRKWTQIELAKRLALGGQTDSQVTKKIVLGRLCSISLANNRLMDVTQLMLTWVERSNGEKFASTSVQI